MSGFLPKVGALTVKDLRSELRGRDTVVPMIVFALVAVVLLAFAMPDVAGDLRRTASVGQVAGADALAAFVWITILFAGLIGFARTFEIERTEGALDALLLAPLDRSAHFLAKGAANLVFILIVEICVLAAVGLFFSVDLADRFLALLTIVILVDIGFVATGTLFSSIAARTRSREFILPILALPALVPVFLAAFELVADLFAGNGFGHVAARGWFGILVAFDVIVGIASALAFEFTLDA